MTRNTFPSRSLATAAAVLFLSVLLAGLVDVAAQPSGSDRAPSEPRREAAGSSEREWGWGPSAHQVPGARWDEWSDFFVASPVDPAGDPLGWFRYQQLRAGSLAHRAAFIGKLREQMEESDRFAALAEPDRERIRRIVTLREELIALDKEHFVSLFRSEAEEVLEALQGWEERTDEDSPRRRIATASRERLERLLEEGEDYESLASAMREAVPERFRGRHRDREDRLQREIDLLERRLDNLRKEVNRLEWEDRPDDENEEDPRARRLREEERRLSEEGVLQVHPQRQPRREERALMPGLERNDTSKELKDPADEEPRGRRDR